MNCKNCGTSVSPNHKFCLNCGTPINSVEPQANIENQNLNNTVEQSTVNPVSVMPVEQPAVTQAPIMPVEQPAVTQTPIMPVEQPAVTQEPVMPVGQPPVTQAPVMPVGQPQMNNMVQPQYQQPNMNVLPQQPQVAPMGTMPVAQPKKDNKLVFIIIGIVAVTAVIIAIMFFVLGGDKEEKAPNTKEDNNVVEKETQKEEDEEELTTKSVKVGNVVYNYPSNYESIESDSYASFKSDDYYIALSVIEDVSGTSLTEEVVKTILEDDEVTLTSVTTKTIDGKNYIVGRSTDENLEYVFLYATDSDDYAMFGAGFRMDLTYNEELESIIASFITNSVYEPTSGSETEV